MHLEASAKFEISDYVNYHGQIQAPEVTDLQDLTSKFHSRDGHYNFIILLKGRAKYQIQNNYFKLPKKWKKCLILCLKVRKVRCILKVRKMRTLQLGDKQYVSVL